MALEARNATSLFAVVAALGLAGFACHSSNTPATRPVAPADAGGTVYLWESSTADGGVVHELDALFPNPFWFRNVCDGAPQSSGSCCYFPAPDGGGSAALTAQYS